MCNRQFPEVIQFGEVNGPLQTWVSQKDAQLVQISCRATRLPWPGASCIERGTSFGSGRGWDGLSLYIQAGLRPTALPSQPPPCWDHSQALPCPGFNLILINLSKVLGNLLHRGDERDCPLQWHRHLQHANKKLHYRLCPPTVSTLLGVKRHTHSAWSPCRENASLNVPEHICRRRLTVKIWDWIWALKILNPLEESLK